MKLMTTKDYKNYRTRFSNFYRKKGHRSLIKSKLNKALRIYKISLKYALPNTLQLGLASAMIAVCYARKLKFTKSCKYVDKALTINLLAEHRQSLLKLRQQFIRKAAIKNK